MSQRIDELLAQIPDPSQVRDAAAWDDVAAETLARATSARADVEAIEAVLGPPELAPEPGEPEAPGSTSNVTMSNVTMGTGTSAVPMSQKQDATRFEPAQIPGARSQMSDDSDSQPRPSRARPSLKDLAVRVSKTPPPPVSSRAGSSPDVRIPPGPISNAPIVLPRTGGDRVSSAPLSQAPIAVPAAPASTTSAPPASAPSTAPESAAARASQPVSAAPSKAPPTLASTKTSAEEKGGSLVWLYGLVGVGVAAAAGYFLFVKQPDAAPPAPAATVVAAEESKKTQEADLATPQPSKPEGEAPKEDAVDLNALGDATAKPVVGGGRLHTPGSGEAVALAAPSGTPWTPPEEKKIEKVDPNSTFDEALAEKAGPIDKKTDGTPAADDTGPKNLPDQPPQGSLSSAASAARAAAKSCVAGADENTSINLVFGSNGAVKSVAVGGWAAGKAAEGCIKSAVKGVTVSPFSKATYPLSVTLRP